MALVLFTGGARSGKSSAAQALAQRRHADGVAVTVAVFGRADGDLEFADRIARHQAARPSGFGTVEVASFERWSPAVACEELLLVDCLGTLLGLCMEHGLDATSFPERGDAIPAKQERAVEEAFSACIDDLLRRRGDTIVVTNEVGDGIVPEYASGRLFRDLLGRGNRRLADAADAAYLVVAGRLVDLTARSREARWPQD